jgi:hypothetical protein
MTVHKGSAAVIRALEALGIRSAVAVAVIVLSGCVSGPQMPTEPVRCFDSDGHEIPCVDEMDCHEEMGSVKEQA